jgi:hypothetical protein
MCFPALFWPANRGLAVSRAEYLLTLPSTCIAERAE